MKNYIEQHMLNSNTFVTWSEQYKNDFNAAKEWVLSLYNFLERRFMIKNDSLSYKAGKDANLKIAVAFTMFSNALSCYISSLHLAWNGHIRASAMLVRRIYELLVDLGFMLQKDTDKRLKRFIEMADVWRYQRLCYLCVSSKELDKKLRREYGELKKVYMRHRRKYGYFKRQDMGKSVYIFTGDWAFGLLKRNRRTFLREKAERIGLGNLHYELGYSDFSAKSHPAAWDIASKAGVIDGFQRRITYKILPDKEDHFRPVLMCGLQYMVAFFIVFANIFNIIPLDKDKDKYMLEKTKKIRENSDYKEFFKKIKMKKNIGF